MKDRFLSLAVRKTCPGLPKHLQKTAEEMLKTHLKDRSCTTPSLPVVREMMRKYDQLANE